MMEREAIALNGDEQKCKPRIGNDNICPITKQSCSDETCSPGAECNVSGLLIDGTNLNLTEGFAFDIVIPELKLDNIRRQAERQVEESGRKLQDFREQHFPKNPNLHQGGK